jgi:nicotinamide-nucleotide amidase
MKYELCTDYDQMFENIVEYTRDYIDGQKIKTLVIGMSGGIDSTLTAALAREVVNRCIAKVELKGLVLPIQSDKIEMERAVTAAKAFCDSYEYKDMTAAYMALAANIVSVKFGGHSFAIRCGNIKARLRMIKLYDTAQKMNGMVLSTDNYTEYLLGFWTLHGDVGDYGMIQNLWKTEVYSLANYLFDKYKKDDELYKAIALLEGIKAMPTDGLGISKSDFDQIYPDYDKNSTPVNVYGSIDVLLLNYLNDVHLCPDNGVVIKRHKATEFKRKNPSSIPRENLVG